MSHNLGAPFTTSHAAQRRISSAQSRRGLEATGVGVLLPGGACWPSPVRVARQQGGSRPGAVTASCCRAIDLVVRASLSVSTLTSGVAYGRSVCSVRQRRSARLLPKPAEDGRGG